MSKEKLGNMLWIRLDWSSDSNVELWRSSNWLCRTKQWWFIAMKTFMNVIFQLRLSKLNMDVQNEVPCTLCKLHWKYPGQIFFCGQPKSPQPWRQPNTNCDPNLGEKSRSSWNTCEGIEISSWIKKTRKGKCSQKMMDLILSQRCVSMSWINLGMTLNKSFIFCPLRTYNSLSESWTGTSKVMPLPEAIENAQRFVLQTFSPVRHWLKNNKVGSNHEYFQHISHIR